MKSIKAVLKEELDRLNEAERSYLSEIARRPKGSIHRKEIRGHQYPYLSYRDGGAVISRYLGKLSAEELEKLRGDLKERKRYQLLLRQVRENRSSLQRMLRGGRI